MDKQRLLRIAVITSYETIHPSVRNIRTTIADVRKLFPNSPLTIYADWPQDFLTKGQRRHYWQYLGRIQRLSLGPIHLMPDWVGLPGIIREICDRTVEPLLFNMQHDWTFWEPERIDSNGIIEALESTSCVAQLIRFSKRKHINGGGHVDTNLVQLEDNPVPLVATDGWADNPHVATMEHYRTRVVPNMWKQRPADGVTGVETPVCEAYRKDIALIGFADAHKRWGVCMYGRLGDFRYVKHTGYATTEWRTELGFWPKRIQRAPKEEYDC